MSIPDSYEKMPFILKSISRQSTEKILSCVSASHIVTC